MTQAIMQKPSTVSNKRIVNVPLQYVVYEIIAAGLVSLHAKPHIAHEPHPVPCAHTPNNPQHISRVPSPY